MMTLARCGALLGLWLVPALGLAAADFEEVTIQDIVLVQIPAGTFTAGTSDPVRTQLQAAKVWTRFEENERPAHAVTISKPFLIGKFEVTQKQWASILGSGGSGGAGKDKKAPSAFHGDDLPVDSVSWSEVQTFLAALNKLTKGKAKFRLPTEAEWEYACRAGSSQAYGMGKEEVAITVENLPEFAWTAANASNKPHPVGTKKPNAWGLHDMHGNVWEWCQDFYAPSIYTNAPSTNPLNSDGKNASERVMRGGSWFLAAPNQRAALRSSGLSDAKSPYVGFRVVAEQ